MESNNLPIRTALVNNFIRIIRSLGKSGRDNFQFYLVHPLAHWSPTAPQEPLEALLQSLKVSQGNEENLARLYKKTIIKSVSPDQFDLAIPGQLSINFLKSMKTVSGLAKTPESREFINLLRSPFKKYSDYEFKKFNKKFKNEIATIDEKKAEDLITISDGKKGPDSLIDEKMEHAYKDLVKRHASENAEQLFKPIINFILEFSHPASPDRHLIIEELLSSINQKKNNFRKEVMDTLAIAIYHDILKAIRENNLQRAVKLMSKFTIIFRGDPETPYYQEVDSFEKIFYTIIEKKNLWDHL